LVALKYCLKNCRPRQDSRPTFQCFSFTKHPTNQLASYIFSSSITYIHHVWQELRRPGQGRRQRCWYVYWWLSLDWLQASHLVARPWVLNSLRTCLQVTRSTRLHAACLTPSPERYLLILLPFNGSKLVRPFPSCLAALQRVALAANLHYH